jgi:hypothetical protein
MPPPGPLEAHALSACLCDLAKCTRHPHATVPSMTATMQSGASSLHGGIVLGDFWVEGAPQRRLAGRYDGDRGVLTISGGELVACTEAVNPGPPVQVQPRAVQQCAVPNL